MTSPEEDFSLTTHGLLVWVSAWSAGCCLKCFNEKADGMQGRAEVLLRIILGSIFGGASYKVEIGGGILDIDNLMCSMAQLKELFLECRRRLSMLPVAAGRIALHKVFLNLASWALRSTKTAQAQAAAKQGLKVLVCFAASVAELSGGITDGTRTASYLTMPLLRGPIGKPKRISAARKCVVVAVAAADPSIRDVGQLAAVSNRLKRAAGEDPNNVSPKSTLKFRKTMLFAYMLKGQQQFESVQHLSLALDGVRAGGHKYLVTSMWSCEAQIGMWLAPQALRGAQQKPPLLKPGFPAPLFGGSPFSRHVWVLRTPISRHVWA